MNGLGLVFALLLVIPVWKRVGPPWAIYVLVSVLLPLLAGGLLSMGRLTAALFRCFWLSPLWFHSDAHPPYWSRSPCSRRCLLHCSTHGGSCFEHPP
jgi:hypothetical protein